MSDDLTLPAIPPASIAQTVEALVQTQTDLVLSVPATDAGTAQWLVDQGHALRKLLEAVEAECAPATQLRRIANTISGRYTQSKRLLATALDYCRSEPIRFKRAAEAAAQAALQAAADTGATQAEIARTAAAVAPAPTGIVEVERWTWERVDGEAPDPEVMIPDERRLDAEVKVMKEKFRRRGFRAVRVNAGQLRR